MKSRSWATVVLIWAWVGITYGQTPSPQPTPSQPVPVQPTAVPQATLAPAQPSIVSQSGPSKELSDAFAKLNAVDSSVAKLAEKSSKTDYTPAVLGLIGSLFGVLIGGFITLRTQRKLLTHQKELAESAAGHTKALADAKAELDRQLAKNRAGLEIGNSLVQWQLKQLSELYGPLRALLEQSNAMYRHMNAVLERADSKRFRVEQGSPGDDFDGKVFEIYLNNEWVRFRTIMHIGEVYGRGYGVEDYFDEVVAIGARLVEVIAQRAGYARPDQPELLKVFGKYLAHYSVLSHLHSQMPGNQSASTHALATGQDVKPMPVVESAAYPKEIQGLVEAGFETINAEIKAWAGKASA